jgi:beta-glucanase (GH16 family)
VFYSALGLNRKAFFFFHPMLPILLSVLASSILAASPAELGVVNTDTETKPLVCKSEGNFDPSACLFKDQFCSFKTDFSKGFSATDWWKYNGNMSSEFVVESGTPVVKDGVLAAPLEDKKVPQAGATIISTTRFLHYGIFEARMKTSIPNPGVACTFIGSIFPVSNTN